MPPRYIVPASLILQSFDTIKPKIQKVLFLVGHRTYTMITSSSILQYISIHE
jgi:hypothetical protein